MFKNFWYAMEESGNVTADRPTKVRVLGQSFVLYRDERGKAHCLHNVCSHRGGSLAHGRVRGGCVECPYHGWTFDGEGSCTRIPSLGPDKQSKLPAKAKMDAYPVREHHGLVFAFLGDLPEDERPPLLLPETNTQGVDYSGPEWRSVTMGWRIDCNYERAVENALDPAHNEYVHPTHGYQGRRPDYHVPDFDLSTHAWGNGFMVEFKAPRSGGEDDSEMGNNTVLAGSGHNGPNQVWTFIEIAPGCSMHQYLYETPVDATHTRAFNITMCNFLPPAIDMEDLKEMNARIAHEDVVVLQEVEPVETPDDMRSEVMMPADRSIVRYRKFLSQWEARGWRLDSEASAEGSRKRVRVIASPRRRREQGWVFEEASCVPARPEERSGVIKPREDAKRALGAVATSDSVPPPGE